MSLRGGPLANGSAASPPTDLDIRPATKADIPDLSKLLLMATDGIVASLYDGVIPGLATHASSGGAPGRTPAAPTSTAGSRPTASGLPAISTPTPWTT
jgi:hypothetical protein